jgi:hypothetical protein
MKRAALDRPRVLSQWRRRHPGDAHLSPGYFRKRRRPDGCPRFCIYCRARKSIPNRQSRRAALLSYESLLEVIYTPVRLNPRRLS